MRKPFLLRTLVIILSFLPLTTFAADTLFTINGEPTGSQEFKYSYIKNDVTGKLDFSKKSVDSYLQLFIDYKLKIKQAEDLGLDTVPSLKQEYEGYRAQLLNSYIEKKVLIPLIGQEYNRSKKDVRIAHVFVLKKSKDALAKIQKAYHELEKGVPFSQVAKKYSEDTATNKNGGEVGYFTAMQVAYPQLEDAFYNTPVGKFSPIVATDFGYHIIKVEDVRPARGKIKVAIIKLNIPKDSTKQLEVKNRIDSLYQVLKSSKDDLFGQLALRYSEDSYSASSGGELDWFGINRYIKVFEDAAFSLKEDGEISEPVRTSTAWYLIKRLSKVKEATFKDEEPVLRTKILTSKMYQIKQKEFNDYLAQIGHLELDSSVLKTFLDSLAIKTVASKLIVDPKTANYILFSLQGKKYSQSEVVNLMNTNSMKVNSRLGQNRIDALYQLTMQDLLNKVYEQKLIDSVPDYKSLLNEYRNGVLIFELTKEKVWNKAVNDTLGLQDFYKSLGNKYMWNERAQVIRFGKLDGLTQDDLAKWIKKKRLNSIASWSDFLSKNKDLKIQVSEETIEKKVTDGSEKIDWTLGLHRDETGALYQVIKLIPTQKKDLADVKGYVIAAYQDYLENQWVQNLRNQYQIDVHESTLNNLIRK